MKRSFRITAAALAALMMASGCGSSASQSKVKLNPDEPVELSVWHYYNGMQQQVFDELVMEFNETVGSELGIIVEGHGKGSVNELADAIESSANHEVGAEEMPDVFASYADNAFDLNKRGLVADLTPYMTKEELDEYVDSYVKEGYLEKDGEFKLFPIAKSTEVLLLNETTWNEFASRTGADRSKLATWEGLVELAEQYYNWTDAMTPDIPNDGASFFGRDAFANYILVGSLQLGHEMFKVVDGKLDLDIDKDTMHRLWNCFYVPYVNGWYGAYGKFRSDDIKTGQIIALVGSTSGALYFPSEVTRDNGTTYPIECSVFAAPNFKGTEPYAVQQGAGFVVSAGEEQTEYAATVFLKWMTEPEHNISMSINSGYLPVKKAANDISLIEKSMDETDATQLMRDVVETGVKMTNSYTLYTNHAFENGNAARKVAEYNMPDAAAAAVTERDALIASGMSREDAVAQLTGEDAFEAWFAEFENAMHTVIED